jgi:hypothetical protein
MFPKIIIATSGALALFIKLREGLSHLRRKQELKTDLEIYELSKNNGIESFELKNNLEKRINQILNTKNNKITSFLAGVAVFVGFGLWSINIYQNDSTFNGWIVVTIFVALAGLSLMFETNEVTEPKGTFLQLHFKDRTNFVMGMIITLLCGIVTPILIIKTSEFTFWQFVFGLFFFIGIFSLIKNIYVVK